MRSVSTLNKKEALSSYWNDECTPEIRQLTVNLGGTNNLSFDKNQYTFHLVCDDLRGINILQMRNVVDD